MSDSIHRDGILQTAVFITFSGNCRLALTHYQTCLGGTLEFNLFEHELPGYNIVPVVFGVLKTSHIHIYGSDLGPEEGRAPGNHMSIFLVCSNEQIRRDIIEKLVHPLSKPKPSSASHLTECVDQFDVHWVIALI